MKVIIAGDRNFTDYDFVKEKLDYYLSDKTKSFIIISGNARGVDSLGERYARENNLPLEVYPADWDKYGKSAGMIRNRQMADVADGLIAFPSFSSIGTKGMINEAKKRGLSIRIVNI